MRRRNDPRSARRRAGRCRSRQIGGDDILPVVLVLDAEARADLLQAGQHDVDGQGFSAISAAAERDEFPARDPQLLRCGRLRSSGPWIESDAHAKTKCAGGPAHRLGEDMNTARSGAGARLVRLPIRRRLGAHALFLEEGLQFAGLEHLADDVAAADELALDVELRDRRPVGIVLDALAQVGRRPGRSRLCSRRRDSRGSGRPGRRSRIAGTGRALHEEHDVVALHLVGDEFVDTAHGRSFPLRVSGPSIVYQDKPITIARNRMLANRGQMAQK